MEMELYKNFERIQYQAFERKDHSIAESIQNTLACEVNDQVLFGWQEEGMRLFHQAGDQAVEKTRTGAIPVQLNEHTQGWLRHLWRKATTEDDWSAGGNPHPWWDQYSLEPMLSFPRFDLTESSYALLLMGRKTPAWREVYTRILDELVQRHTTHWAAVDWLTRLGPDPDRGNYPKAYKSLIPKDLWGEYDAPGWTANGIEPWGLQPDPIGSDGNLFFRGFFALLLAIHRSVSGETTWEKPFEVTGLDDRTFPWTHTEIASYLSDHWQKNPQGPHCENTKVWPFCLSGAGLGLQLTDLTTGSDTHGIYDQWLEDTFKSRFLDIDRRGNLRKVGLYHDPILDRTHMGPRLAGLAPAFYMLPQNREMAELLYRSAVSSIGWDKKWLPVIGPTSQPRLFSIALILAREFGDHTTERRMANKLASFENGRYFNGGDGGDQNEFGYFFKFGEAWPRGQESALLMLRELLDGEGELYSAFNTSDAEKFTAPTVTEVDYPNLGLSAAHNDNATSTLKLETYAATPGVAGKTTDFCVTQLPDVSIVSVLRDGMAWGNWEKVDADTIRIKSDIGSHRFEIYTGHRGGAQLNHKASSTQRGETSSTGHRATRLRVQDVASTAISMGPMGSSCPCC